MLELSLLGIPIGIEWIFWLSCIFMGGGLSAGGNPDAWMLVGIWTWVVLISITVHEIGHALAARRFGANPIIRLHGFGGVTIIEGAHFSKAQDIFVSAAGPLSSLALGAFVWLIAEVYPPEGFWTFTLVYYAKYVNFFWTAINLLPIQPMDGGQIFRELMGARRAHITNAVGVACAIGTAYWAYTKGQPYLMLMMLFFAWKNFSGDYGEGGVITH